MKKSVLTTYPKNAPLATLSLVRAEGSGHLSKDDPFLPVQLYLESLMASGKRAQRVNLERAARLLGGSSGLDSEWHLVRFGHVEILRSKLQGLGYSSSVINGTLSAIRGVARRAWHLGQMKVEDYQRICDVRGVRGGHRVRPVRALSVEEIASLLEACERAGGPQGARDSALVALLYGGGLRRDEARRLTLVDYSRRNHTLKVHGKGDRDRSVYFDDGGARRALHNWLRERGEDAGPFLCPVNKGGRITLRSLSGNALYDALLKRARQAGIKRLSPHDLRRSFATQLFDDETDAALVQALLGHVSVTTTVRYDLRSEKQKRRASQKIHVPFRETGRRPRKPRHGRRRGPSWRQHVRSMLKG